jgi:uncharacterized membrane protein YGL010W
MPSLAQQLDSYAAYHQDVRNKMTHVLGVPLVSFAVFLALGWLRFVHAPEVFCTGATVFALVVFLYYLYLDWQVALSLFPFYFLLLYLADHVARWDFFDSLMVFLATFLGGWIVQLIGHVIEGRRPALGDNVLQIFNAPLFLTVEAAFLLGYRDDLRQAVNPPLAAGDSAEMARPNK